MVRHGKAWNRAPCGSMAIGILILAASGGATAGSAPIAKNAEVSIPFADRDGIRDWRGDGSKGLWILAASGHWFYARFSSQCTTLPTALGVKFVPEPSGVLSRWSSIRLAHDERCFFRSLQPSDAPPKKAGSAQPRPALGNAENPARAGAIRVVVTTERATC